MRRQSGELIGADNMCHGIRTPSPQSTRRHHIGLLHRTLYISLYCPYSPELRFYLNIHILDLLTS